MPAGFEANAILSISEEASGRQEELAAKTCIHFSVYHDQYYTLYWIKLVLKLILWECKFSLKISAKLSISVQGKHLQSHTLGDHGYPLIKLRYCPGWFWFTYLLTTNICVVTDRLLQSSIYLLRISHNIMHMRMCCSASAKSASVPALTVSHFSAHDNSTWNDD